jgi:hypothetical protein
MIPVNHQPNALSGVRLTALVQESFGLWLGGNLS